MDGHRQPRRGGGAPPQKRPIPLRSIGRFCGGLVPRGLTDKDLHYRNGCLQGQGGIALAWVVILGFIRITTHPGIFENPLPVGDALDRVEEWLTQPQVHLIHPPQAHFPTLSTLLKSLGTAGNLTTDAHLAALAIDRGLILHTTDADFARFPGLKWENPLAP